jgi:glycosyltransferase involved in cell wall biosynthesis
MAPRFTICIPSFNRGHCALRQVLQTLPLIQADWEILVLDNFSSSNLEGYGEILTLSKSDNRVRYVRHAQNRGFHGNVISCLKLANSPYLQIVSDEDYSNPRVVRDAIDTLDEFPHVGLIRGSIGAVEGMKPRNSTIYPDQFLTAGISALADFSLTTNYVTGVIYNKQLLNSRGIIQAFESGLANNPMVAGYAHMYLDILTSASCAVITSNEIIGFEGAEFSAMPDIKAMARNEAYTFSARLEQFIGFREAFVEVCSHSNLNNLSLLIHLYLRLVQKYCSLFRIDSFLYTARGLSLEPLQESLKQFFIAAAEIEEFVPVRNMVHEMVQERFQLCLPTKSELP